MIMEKNYTSATILIQQMLFAYKAGKEVLIKRVADEYKPMLDDKVYDALLKYVVFDTNGIVQID